VVEPDGSPDLPALIRHVQDGDRHAFGRLVARIEGNIRRWALRLVDEDDADDVTQDVLLLVERRLPQFEARSRFSTWLYRITQNVALERRRKDARRARRLEVYVPDGTSEPVDRVDESALASIVLRYFAELPARQREIFELADLKGLTAAEIAERLDMKPVTVRANLFKARRTIRERMLADYPRMLEEYRS
jgi:RNA polymerase sigma-70 factor (ECF subfamily)